MFLTVVLLSGCASSGTSCEWLTTGVYQVHYTERLGGTCGPIADALLATNSQQDPAVSCTDGHWTLTDGGCTRLRGWTCQNADSMVLSTEALEYVSDGDWSGTYSAHVSGGASCASVYDIVVLKQ